ncbi:hypothetical protein WL74_29670 [Burkholderia cepacia]|nr:hypothetical protein WL74_29670 [Burkholderia cepacia]
MRPRSVDILGVPFDPRSILVLLRWPVPVRRRLMIGAERLAAVHASAHANLRNRMYRDPRARSA